MANSESTFGVHSSRPLSPVEWDEHIIVNGVHAKKTLPVDATGSVFGTNAVKVEVSGSITYVAVAAPGTAQSTAAWQCKKIDTTSGVVITYADGNANFDNIATDLTALTYS